MKINKCQICEKPKLFLYNYSKHDWDSFYYCCEKCIKNLEFNEFFNAFTIVICPECNHKRYYWEIFDLIAFSDDIMFKCVKCKK